MPHCINSEKGSHQPGSAASLKFLAILVRRFDEQGSITADGALSGIVLTAFGAPDVNQVANLPSLAAGPLERGAGGERFGNFRRLRLKVY